MNRIEEIVLFGWDDDRRNRQNSRLPIAEPSFADGLGGVASLRPTGGKCGGIQKLDKGIGELNLQGYPPSRSHFEMDAHLHQSERSGGGRIDDATSPAMPTTIGMEPARAVEARAIMAAEAMDNPRSALKRRCRFRCARVGREPDGGLRSNGSR